MPETPRRKGDRGEMRLQVARRQTDDQPAEMALAHRRQFCGDQLDVPVAGKGRARVELRKTAHGKAHKIVAQYRRAVVPRDVSGDSRWHSCACFETRGLVLRS